MIRSFRYRLYPTRAQADVLVRWLDLTRELYNAALQERRDAWRLAHKSISYFDQCAAVPAIREARPEFREVPVWVMRGILRRLDRAFAAFFQRCKMGGKPGFPRFKSRARFDSIIIEDISYGHGTDPSGKRVRIPLLGKVKFKQHRPFAGTPKAIRLTRDARGRWFVTFACVDVPVQPLPATGCEVGVDLGLIGLAVTDTGERFPNPKPLAAARIEIERAQRRLSRRKRGSRRRRKAARLLAIKHERVANVRREHHIAVARSLVARHDLICIEDLNVKGLAGGMLAKQVSDAGWSGLCHWIRVKAEEAGREVVAVPPAGTSQTCSGCGVIVPKELSQRIHRCPHCGLVLDRDENAARNILRLGRSLRRGAPVVDGPRRPEKITASG